VSASQLLVTMTPAGFQNLDTIDGGAGTCIGNGTCPWGGGADPNALAIFSTYPAVNSDALATVLITGIYVSGKCSPKAKYLHRET